MLLGYVDNINLTDGDWNENRYVTNAWKDICLIIKVRKTFYEEIERHQGDCEYIVFFNEK